MRRFLQNPVLHAVAVERFLIMRNLVRQLAAGLLDGKLLLQHEVKGLADAGGLNALHGFHLLLAGRPLLI